MTTKNNTGAQVNGPYDLCDLLALSWEAMDNLTEDATDALEELFDDLTILDYNNGNHYWDLDVDDDVTNALIEKYAPRLWWGSNGDPIRRDRVHVSGDGYDVTVWDDGDGNWQAVGNYFDTEIDTVWNECEDLTFEDIDGQILAIIRDELN
jgi:hypothetical protein